MGRQGCPAWEAGAVLGTFSVCAVGACRDYAAVPRTELASVHDPNVQADVPRETLVPFPSPGRPLSPSGTWSTTILVGAEY